jgi:phosphoribosylformylglycinamidine synthase subunit PurSL
MDPLSTNTEESGSERNTMNQHLLVIRTKAETELKLFWVLGSVSTDQLTAVRERIIDSVDQDLWINPTLKDWAKTELQKIEVVRFLPGVTDNSAIGVRDLLILSGIPKEDIQEVHSGVAGVNIPFNRLIQDSKAYNLFSEELEDLVALQFLNPRNQVSESKAVRINGLSKAELVSLSKMNHWALNAEEMIAIQDHFNDRDPTDVEIEVIAQTWSEHCKHKIFNADIQYTDTKGSREINSLFKTYIAAPTQALKKRRPWLISVFKDNAGIVRFHPKLDVCIKVETHNSPSALDPYGGALTGILGVNRDILGTGIGARPIANTNVLCFGPQEDIPELPIGLHQPRKVLAGVHKGIQDGGNKSGIPTVNGAMLFDDSFAGKPLVFCGTVGVLPHSIHGSATFEKRHQAGDLIVVIGGSVGLDGIHGATASSVVLDESTPSSMVQIGDPLTQKRVTDFLMEARDLGLYSSITDNGAGGLSSSVGEMAVKTGGARIELDRVPLKYPNLDPWQIFVSESQERMTIAVPPARLSKLQKLAQERGVQVAEIGVFTSGGFLEVFYRAQNVARLDLGFLHDGNPTLKLNAAWDGPRPPQKWRTSNQPPATFENPIQWLKIQLADHNIASKERWIRQYDHEVQAATVLKPLEGSERVSPNDAGVIWLSPGSKIDFAGVTVGSGLCPKFSRFDAKIMAQLSVDEAVRNTVVTGADPDQLCLVDNFAWPNPEVDPYIMGQLVRACEGLSEIVLAYEMPLVSGKDSMKNDFIGLNSNGDTVSISVEPTLLVTALAAHPDVKTTVRSAARPGDRVYLLGNVKFEKSFEPHRMPDVSPWKFKDTVEFYRRYFQATKKGLIRFGHDVSEGGVLVALSESLFLHHCGIAIETRAALQKGESENSFFFLEYPGLFIVGVSEADDKAFQSHFPSNQRRFLGTANSSGVLAIRSDERNLSVDIETLRRCWGAGP